MSEEQMNQVRQAQAAIDSAVHSEPTVVDPDPVAADPTPADPNTVGQAAVEIAEETKNQAAEAKQDKPARRTPVKGVVAKARELLAQGETEEVIIGFLTSMYTDAGRDAKNAKDSAYVVLHDVKNRPVKD